MSMADRRRSCKDAEAAVYEHSRQEETMQRSAGGQRYVKHSRQKSSYRSGGSSLCMSMAGKKRYTKGSEAAVLYET
jgi:hypothetical protein